MLETYITRCGHVGKLSAETDTFFCVVLVSRCVPWSCHKVRLSSASSTHIKADILFCTDKRQHPHFLGDISRFTRFAVKAHANPCSPSSKLPAQVKNSEPVNESASDVSVIPFTVPSHHLDGGFYQQPRLLVGQGCNMVQSNLSSCQYVKTPSFLFIMLIVSAKLL